MAYEILMPRLGWNMEEGVLVEWLKKNGDQIQSGDLVCTIEGDKATTDIESFESGILRIHNTSPDPGVTVQVGTLLGYVVPENELDQFDPNLVPKSSDKPIHVGAPDTIKLQAKPARKSSIVKDKNDATISPRARRIATELGVEWQAIQGSGRTGRIIEADIRQAARFPSNDPCDSIGHRSNPVGNLRGIIANRMIESSQTTAPVTLTSEIDVTELANIRKSWPKNDSLRPAYHDLLLELVGKALPEFPSMNASWDDDKIITHDQVNIGIAVDTDRGLIVPVIANVPEKSIETICTESKQLINAARMNTLLPAQIQNGTFTITNLGMYGIDAFTPIINLPQCAILGIGRITSKVVVLDELKSLTGIRKMVFLSLTFDHRVVDGAYAARFLHHLGELIHPPL